MLIKIQFMFLKHSNVCSKHNETIQILKIIVCQTYNIETVQVQYTLGIVLIQSLICNECIS